LKKKCFLLFFVSISLVMNSSCQKDTHQQLQQDLPIIRLAYAWGKGFENTIADYINEIEGQFILETEENLGLNHKQKILIDVSSNDLPDVFFFWSYETNLKFLALSDHLLDIQEYFDESSEVRRSDFYPEALNATEINSINYAIPHERFYGFFAVNKAIFEEFNLPLPETWNDFNQISPVLLENGITPLSMGSFRGDPGHLFFSALTYQEPNGYKDTHNIKKENNFIYPGTIQAADAILDLIAYEAIPKNTIYSGSWDHQINLYNERKAAMIFTFNWSLALFDKDISKESLIIPVPRINRQTKDTATFTVGGVAQNICINKASWNDPRKRKAIIHLIDWLLSDEVFITRVFQSGCFPAKKVIIPEFENQIYNKVIDFISTQEIYGIHEFYFNSLNSFNIYKEANDLLWSGAITREEFLQMIQKGMLLNNE